MTTDTGKRKIIVMPCSGIGKVHGLIAREATYAVADEMENVETMCLALLVSGDEEALAKLRKTDCIAIDGCPKLCAAKNVEMAGGKVVRSIRVVDSFKNHRGAEPGTATTLANDGWTIVQEITGDITGCGCSESEVS
ncbi:MAG: putative zinc-binding protein [Armatimonadota bacterium]|nr:putative zinc-binding protein [bacterium]